jgi:NADPH-dependent curcumin reductase CurA
MTSGINHQIRLAGRPVGLPKRSDWQFTEAPIPEPRDGEVLTQVLYLSLDPAMRGWMNEGKSYIAPVGIGDVMRAGAVGKVVASKHPKFAVNDYVSGGFGVQEYATLDGARVELEMLSAARSVSRGRGVRPLWTLLDQTLGKPGLSILRSIGCMFDRSLSSASIRALSRVSRREHASCTEHLDPAALRDGGLRQCHCGRRAPRRDLRA